VGLSTDHLLLCSLLRREWVERERLSFRWRRSARADRRQRLPGLLPAAFWKRPFWLGARWSCSTTSADLPVLLGTGEGIVMRLPIAPCSVRPVLQHAGVRDGSVYPSHRFHIPDPAGFPSACGLLLLHALQAQAGYGLNMPACVGGLALRTAAGWCTVALVASCSGQPAGTWPASRVRPCGCGRRDDSDEPVSYRISFWGPCSHGRPHRMERPLRSRPPFGALVGLLLVVNLAWPHGRASGLFFIQYNCTCQRGSQLGRGQAYEGQEIVVGGMQDSSSPRTREALGRT